MWGPPAGSIIAAVKLRRFLYVLLLLECVALLVPALYAHDHPRLFGIPFFYWYQILWLPGSTILTGAVYLVTRPRRATPARDPTRD